MSGAAKCKTREYMLKIWTLLALILLLFFTRLSPIAASQGFYSNHKLTLIAEIKAENSNKEEEEEEEEEDDDDC